MERIFFCWWMWQIVSRKTWTCWNSLPTGCKNKIHAPCFSTITQRRAFQLCVPFPINEEKRYIGSWWRDSRWMKKRNRNQYRFRFVLFIQFQPWPNGPYKKTSKNIDSSFISFGVAVTNGQSQLMGGEERALCQQAWLIKLKKDSQLPQRNSTSRVPCQERGDKLQGTTKIHPDIQYSVQARGWFSFRAVSIYFISARASCSSAPASSIAFAHSCWRKLEAAQRKTAMS